MSRNLIILLLLLSLSIQKTLKSQIDTSNLSILEYGYPPNNDYLNARATIAGKWNIQYNSVSGCIVSDQLVDSVKKHNDEVFIKITSRYGPNWQSNFDLEVEKELEVQKDARALIDLQPYIFSLDSTLYEDGNGLYYYLEQTKLESTYSAVVFGYGPWEGKTKLVTYYKLLINIKENSVSIKSDKIELFK